MIEPAVSKKVLLLNPPLAAEECTGSLSKAMGGMLPYGLLSLAAVIRQAGYTPLFLDAEVAGLNLQATVEKILSLQPDYLGIATFTISVDRAAELARQVKQRYPRLPIIAGGPHMSSVPDETMERYPAFDIGVVGEAEVSFLKLLQALDQHAPLSSVRGILYREQGAVVKNPRELPIQNLDTLPMPAWDLAPNLANHYRPSAPSYLRLPSTTIVTSRGCNGCCIFCNSVAIHGGLRSFSVEYVINMIRHLQQHYGIRDLAIYDDNFLHPPERVEQFCKTLLDEKLDLTWSCYSRVDQGSYELFRLMKRAGCWQLSYGIESGSQEILDFIRKKVSLAQIEKTVAETKRAGLHTRGFFMIGHLTETKATIEKTIAFMKKIALDDFHFTAFTPLPGTYAYKIADQHGSFDRTWNKMSLQYQSFIPHGLTPEAIEAYSKQAYWSFYFRPKILCNYFIMLLRHPTNFMRLWNGLQALLSRIFFKSHSDTQTFTQSKNT